MFPGWSVQELEEGLDAINSQLDTGAQTGVAIAPGMKDDFAGIGASDLRRRRDEYLYALSVADPDNYANPYQRPGQTTQAFA
jgi:hypothetical protein